MPVKTDNAAEVGLHVFERAGLGKAPFRCIGMEEKTYQPAPGVTLAAGCCAYCSNGIRYVYIVRDRHGKTFGVGCDCVEKTGDVGLIRSYKQRPELRALNRAKAKAKDDRVSAEFGALLEQHAAALAAVIVPGRPWIDGDTTTALENYKRLWGMCGAAGRARTLKMLKTRLADMGRA